MDHFDKTPSIYPNISNEHQFRINKINEIKDYFLAGIREKKLISKNFSKYIASLDCFNKTLNLYYQAAFLLRHLQVLLERLQG